jgi:hypothetical protein
MADVPPFPPQALAATGINVLRFDFTGKWAGMLQLMTFHRCLRRCLQHMKQPEVPGGNLTPPWYLAMWRPHKPTPLAARPIGAGCLVPGRQRREQGHDALCQF